MHSDIRVGIRFLSRLSFPFATKIIVVYKLKAGLPTYEDHHLLLLLTRFGVCFTNTKILFCEPFCY